MLLKAFESLNAANKCGAAWEQHKDSHSERGDRGGGSAWSSGFGYGNKEGEGEGADERETDRTFWEEQNAGGGGGGGVGSKQRRDRRRRQAGTPLSNRDALAQSQAKRDALSALDLR